MIESILGSVAAEKTLLWLDRFETGYASEIARYSGLSTSQVNKQLAKFEDSGLIKARPAGRTRLYVWIFQQVLQGIHESHLTLRM